MITNFRWVLNFSVGVKGGVQFLHKNNLKSETFINKNVFLSKFKLRIKLLLKDGMVIKDKKKLYVMGVH